MKFSAKFFLLFTFNSVLVPAEEVDEVNTNTITVQLKNMDVVEVLKLLASKADIDIIVSQNVRGRVTLFLENVPVWDAMQIVFETAGLAYVEKDGVYRIITEREYEKEFGRKFHDKRNVKVIKLEYALSSEIVRQMKHLKSRVGNVISDDRTNSVILIDTPESISLMEKAIKELDIPMENGVFELKYTPAKTLEESLKAILSKKGKLHVDDLTNKIIITDIPEVIREAELIIKEYDRPEYLETKIFKLNYAKYDQVEEKIKELLTPDIGIVKSDERTNKVVVTDLPEKIKQIERIIKEYDERNKEVLIEAKVVQVALNDTFRMGINWQLILNKVWVDRIFNTDTVDVTLSQVFASLSETGTSDTAPFDNSTRAAHSSGRILIAGTLKEGHDIDAIIDALKTAGETNLLSSPRILALNNQEARIQVGTREAFVTNTVVQSDTAATTAENVTFIDVGVILTVTPTIGDDEFITLKIKPEVSSVARTITTAEGNQIPIVRTQEAETTVMVKDGTTILLGGLIEDQQVKTTNRIPILGSIPILGIPFRHVSNQVVKNELVIFLTPRIATGDVDIVSPSPELQRYIEKVEDKGKEAERDVNYKPIPIEPLTTHAQSREKSSLQTNFTHR